MTCRTCSAPRTEWQLGGLTGVGVLVAGVLETTKEQATVRSQLSAASTGIDALSSPRSVQHEVKALQSCRKVFVTVDVAAQEAGCGEFRPLVHQLPIAGLVPAGQH